MAVSVPEEEAFGWTPSNKFEKGAVQQQLEHLLASPLFHSSRRYPQFLRFVVTRVLDGQTDELKERLLGVEVFERTPDYDTNKDPIVRVTAADIRKRIEQYYQDPKHSREIRLFLPAGSYAPHFSWPGHAPGTTVATDLPSEPSDTRLLQNGEHAPVRQELAEVHAPVVVPISNRHVIKREGARLGLAAVVLVLALTSLEVWRASRPSTLKEFWGPFINSSEPVLFCVADQVQDVNIRLRDAADPARETMLPDHMVTVIIDDVSPLVNMAGVLRSYGKTYRVLGESTTSLTDLRRGPSVFIGAFDNIWTLRFTAPLRFHFMNDPMMTEHWIEDRTNSGKRDWVLNRSEYKNDAYKDYAIVARFVDTDSDQYTVVAAGIGRGGTVAAGEFLVDEHRMDEMLSQAPRDWNRKNLEVVLETQVIQGRSGPPHVSAVYVW